MGYTLEDKIQDNIAQNVIVDKLKVSFGLGDDRAKEYVVKYDKRAE